MTKSTPLRGDSLIEAIVALFVVGILSALFGQLIALRPSNRLVATRAQAAALADVEINALRRLPFASLANQTNGPFKNILNNAGQWRVVADPTNPLDHSAPNVIELLKPSVSVTGDSGRLQLPAATYADVAVNAKWYVAGDSPTGWAIGYYLRTSDAANGYRVLVADSTTDLDLAAGGTQNALIEKIVGGTRMTMNSDFVTISSGSWLPFQASVSGNVFAVSLNGFGILSATDATFASGGAALIGWKGVHAEIDDIQITASQNQTWSFDVPVSPTMPAAWTRLGINDLLDATPTIYDDNGTLTIAPYPDASSTNLKKVTVTVNWVDSNGTQSYATETLIGKSALGQ